jgi:DNA-binding NtrC family response regulator
VSDVLAEAGFDKREAARMLDISLASLYRKLGAESAGTEGIWPGGK